MSALDRLVPAIKYRMDRDSVAQHGFNEVTGFGPRYAVRQRRTSQKPSASATAPRLATQVAEALLLDVFGDVDAIGFSMIAPLE
jgi:hypothetical protein